MKMAKSLIKNVILIKNMQNKPKKIRILRKKEKTIIQGDFIDKAGKKIVYQNHDNDKVIYFDQQ